MIYAPHSLNLGGFSFAQSPPTHTRIQCSWWRPSALLLLLAIWCFFPSLPLTLFSIAGGSCFCLSINQICSAAVEMLLFSFAAQEHLVFSLDGIVTFHRVVGCLTQDLLSTQMTHVATFTLPKTACRMRGQIGDSSTGSGNRSTVYCSRSMLPTSSA